MESKKDDPLKARFLVVSEKGNSQSPHRQEEDICFYSKDTNGKMVGPTFKTMKSELVDSKEVVREKKYDLYDEKQYDQPDLFDNLVLFVKKLCSVMTSVSPCEDM